MLLRFCKVKKSGVRLILKSALWVVSMVLCPGRPAGIISKTAGSILPPICLKSLKLMVLAI